MQLAIDETAAAGVGFAAVIVKDGEVLSRGANRTDSGAEVTERRIPVQVSVS